MRWPWSASRSPASRARRCFAWSTCSWATRSTACAPARPERARKQKAPRVRGLGRARKRGGSGGERLERAIGDLLDAAHAADGAVFRRGGGLGTGPLAVVVHQRAGLRAVDLQALLDGLFLVVVALDQRLAGHVVAAFGLGRVELDVV